MVRRGGVKVKEMCVFVGAESAYLPCFSMFTIPQFLHMVDVYHTIYH